MVPTINRLLAEALRRSDGLVARGRQAVARRRAMTCHLWPKARVVRRRRRLALGRAHRTAGRYAEAERELRLALPGATGIERVAVLNELGMTFKYAGRPAEAAAAYRQALAIAGDNPCAADLLHNLGGAAHAAGDHATALRHARDGLNLRIRIEGAASIKIAADRAALAAILIDLDQLAEATAILTSVLRTYQEVYGREHHETAVALHNLGAAHYAMGGYDRARIVLSQALEVKQTILGPDHPELAITLYNLARVQDRLGYALQGRQLLERCVSVLAGKVAGTHPVLLAARARLDAAAEPAAKA